MLRENINSIKWKKIYFFNKNNNKTYTFHHLLINST